MGKTSIPYAHYTFNPWHGCAEVSEGCAHCFAREIDRRFSGGKHWGASAPRKAQTDTHWKAPLGWSRAAEKKGERRRVLCGSMCDVLEDRRDLDEHRRRLTLLIRETRWLDWMLLTKRIENEHLFDFRGCPNAWLGVTVETQLRAYGRVSLLCETSAPLRFVSCEPLLEEVSLAQWIRGVDLVIAGDESGPCRRAAKEAWFRALRDECAGAATPFFLKQMHVGGHRVDCPSLDGQRHIETP
jgi:protein gp37